MENLVFSCIEDFETILKKDNFLGEGAQGTCYLYNEIWTLKIFKGRYTKYLQSKGIDSILRYQDVEIDNYSFVKCLVFLGDTIAGALSPYTKGKDLTKIPLSSLNINDVASMAKELALSTELLTMLNIRAYDVRRKNIIYGDQGLTVIDTLGFDDFSGQNYNKNLRVNLEMVMSCVINSALGLIDPSIPMEVDYEIVAYFLRQIDSKYKDYATDVNLLMKPDELLLGIKSELEEFIETSISTFSDAKKPLQRKLIK